MARPGGRRGGWAQGRVGARAGGRKGGWAQGGWAQGRVGAGAGGRRSPAGPSATSPPLRSRRLPAATDPGAGEAATAEPRRRAPPTHRTSPAPRRLTALALRLIQPPAPFVTRPRPRPEIRLRNVSRRAIQGGERSSHVRCSSLTQLSMFRRRTGMGSDPLSRMAAWKAGSENADPRRSSASARNRRISALPVR